MNILKELICSKITTGVLAHFGGHTDYQIKEKLKPVFETKKACDFLLC